MNVIHAVADDGEMPPRTVLWDAATEHGRPLPTVWPVERTEVTWGCMWRRLGLHGHLQEELLTRIPACAARALPVRAASSQPRPAPAGRRFITVDQRPLLDGDDESVLVGCIDDTPMILPGTLPLLVKRRFFFYGQRSTAARPCSGPRCAAGGPSGPQGVL